ncbi:hypothetical protein Acr_23g0021910 [Actinidia rufa]|uniref:Tetratricopeptide repeat (TPR)-like superfamily protein n=1 Tax=Actinidia rufa TaxID=165716 RepID=A0A7J0GSM8_9ERIC|nr:hypothetical protein Acr_23g0021910 [Actinidia rufa]
MKQDDAQCGDLPSRLLFEKANSIKNEGTTVFHHHAVLRVTTDGVTPVRDISGCGWIWKPSVKKSGVQNCKPNPRGGERRETKSGRWPNPGPSPDAKQPVKALAKLNDVDSLKRCFEEWESSCSSYDIRLVKVAIRAYLQNDMKNEAESVLHEAFKRSKEPPFRCMESAVSAVKDDEWHPDPNTVNKFLKYFEEAKDVDGAEAICKMLKKINRLDSSAYHSLLLIYIAAGKTAPEMQRKTEEDLIEMNCELEDLLKRVFPE